MTVFKAYLSIIRRNLVMILVYIAISMVIIVGQNSSNSDSTNSFYEAKASVAIIDHDNSEASKNFAEYMKRIQSKSEYDVEDDERAIQDFLYRDMYRVVLIIPEGYSDALDEGEAKVEVMASVEGLASIVENGANRYLANANAMSRAGMSKNEIFEEINSRDSELKINMIKETADESEQRFAYLSMFTAYSLLSIIVVVIGTVICSFDEKMLRRRNAISATSLSKINAQLMLGNALFCAVTATLFYLLVAVFYFDYTFTMRGLIIYVNLIVCSVASGSIAMLVTAFVHKKAALSGIQSVIGMGLSFISGVFVSAEMLGENVIAVAKFFPLYWFVDNCDKIAQYSTIGAEEWRDVLPNIAIMLGFSVAYFVIAMIVRKTQQKSTD